MESSNFLHQGLTQILNEDGARNAEVISYVDDIVYTSSLPLGDYIEGLIALLKQLYKSGLKLNPRKCQILRNTVTFLGYGLRKGQFNIGDEKIRAFTELPTPNTKLSLRYYLNSCA